MAFVCGPEGEDKKSGYTYKGKPILLTKQGGHPLAGIPKRKGWYPESKKIEAVTTFVACGNKKKAAELAKVPYHTLYAWLKEPWAHQIIDEMRQENDMSLDAKISENIGLALEQVKDRVINGDVIVTRHGEQIRVPMKGRDLAVIANTSIDKSRVIRGKPTSISETQSIAGRLEKLVTHFTELAQKANKNLAKPTQIIEDVEYKMVDNEKPEAA